MNCYIAKYMKLLGIDKWTFHMIFFLVNWGTVWATENKIMLDKAQAWTVIVV